MTTDGRHDDAARAEVEALRAALGRFGLGDAVDGTDPADRRTPAEDDAAIAAILGLPHAATTDGGGPDASGTTPAGRPAAPLVDLDARRRRRLRRAGVAATSVAAAVLVAVGVTVLPGSRPEVAVANGSPQMLAYPIPPADLGQGEGEPAHDALLGLAQTAAAQIDPAPAGEVQHVLSQSWLRSSLAADDTTTTTVDPTVDETWLAPDGSLVSLQWRGTHLDADGQLVDVGSSPDDAAVDRIPADTFDAGFVARLSLDPAVLRAQLLAPLTESGCSASSATSAATSAPVSGAWCVYQAVTTLASKYVLPSDLEAAIWTVLADEPGVTLAGEVEDRAGRTSVGIAVPTAPNDVDPVVRVLLVDEATGRVSGLEEVTLSSPVLGLDEPTVTEFRYTVESSWVAEVGGGAAG